MYLMLDENNRVIKYMIDSIWEPEGYIKHEGTVEDWEAFFHEYILYDYINGQLVKNRKFITHQEVFIEIQNEQIVLEMYTYAPIVDPRIKVVIKEGSRVDVDVLHKILKYENETIYMYAPLREEFDYIDERIQLEVFKV